MLTRRQFFANSLATVAGVSLAEWILGPISHASDDKETVKVVQYDGSGQKVGPTRVMKVHNSDDEWRQQLTPLQFQVTREEGTERAFTGEYLEAACPVKHVGAYPVRSATYLSGDSTDVNREALPKRVEDHRGC